MRKLILPLVVVGVLLIGGVYWWLHRRGTEESPVLYGTVEFRQAQLSFNNGERVTEVLVQEGDRVKAGAVLARVATDRLQPQAAAARGQAAAAQAALTRLQNGARPEEIEQAFAQKDALAQTVQKLKQGARPEEIAQAEALATAAHSVWKRLDSGSRPEEIAQAQANVDAAVAADRLATDTLTRLKTLQTESSGAVSQQDLDGAAADAAAAQSRRIVAEKALALAKIGPREEDKAEALARFIAAEQASALVKAGPRVEDIAEAEARLKAAEQSYALVKAGPRAEDIAEARARAQAAAAQAALADQQLSDAELRAPCDGVVRSRILEPGELAAPQRPALILAQVDRKWIRAYLSETELGAVPPGAEASIQVDSFPDKPFSGWVGFISPVAEFTPRAVQTEDLRTSLMYEVRIFVDDPQDQLRLGMPATVHFTGGKRALPADAATAGSTAHPASAGAAQP